MKCVVPVLAFSLLLVAPGFAPAMTPPGTIEVSLSATMENTDVAYGEHGEYGSEDSFLLVPIRVGVFVFRGLELEGDVNLTMRDGESGVSTFVNAVYNFEAREGRVRPFLLAGVGFGNARRELGAAIDVDNSTPGFDVGAGVRFMLGKRTAFRAEYRYDRVTYSQEYIGETMDVIAQGSRLLFGFSLFFNTE